MNEDAYREIAERYDWMVRQDPIRKAFFRTLFVQYGVKSVLDCACGTGWDLVLFASLGCSVQGSDLSEAMLARAAKRLADSRLEIPLHQVDFCRLPEHFEARFDAVVCLSNSINEPLEDSGTLQALRSMKAVLREGGILVFDQGQTDASMANPPRFAPIVNERDFSRLFTMEYTQDRMKVHVFDFIHTEEERDFQCSSFLLRIRLIDSWQQMLGQAGFATAEFFGDWEATPYDKEASGRLIAVAQK
jgi:SAM-dependent methyltransferase